MEGFIEIPKAVRDIKEIHSENVQLLLKNSEYADDKVSLNFLRTLYVQDRALFMNIRDELLLRGFRFYTEKPTSLLPGYQMEPTGWIVSQVDHEQYKSIEFGQYGLSGLLNRFRIESDVFFHLVPLEGFKCLNASVDLVALQYDLERAGFRVVESLHSIEREVEDSGESVGDQDDPVLSKVEIFAVTPVSVALQDDSYSDFIRICEEQGVHYLSQLTDSIVQVVPQPGKVKDAIQELFLLSMTELKAKYPQLEGYRIDKKDLSKGSLRIEEVFHENRFKLFRSFCSVHSIEILGQFGHAELTAFSRANSVGYKKLIDLYERFNNLSSEQHGEIDQSLISVAFAENKYTMFRQFCTLKGLSAIHDLTAELLDEFSTVKGVGMGRYEQIREKVVEYGLGTETEAPLNGMSYGPNIAELFRNTKLAFFVEFCEEKGLQKISEVTERHLNEFSRRPKVGKRKVEQIVEVLTANNWGQGIPDVFELDTLHLYSLLKDFRVNMLTASFGMDVTLESNLSLQELNGKTREEVQEFLPLETLLDLVYRIDKSVTPEDMDRVIRESLKGNEYEVLVYRYGQKLTLEETGEHFGVTRERVRQIAKKAIVRVMTLLRQYFFFEFTQLLGSSPSYISADELLSLVGEESRYLVEILKEQESAFVYFDKLDAFFYKAGKTIDFETVEGVMNDLPTTFFLHEYEDLLEEVLEFLEIDQPETYLIEKLLVASGYTANGDVYSRKRLSIVDALELLFSTYIGGSVLVDEEGHRYLQSLSIKHLNFELPSSVRSLDARLRDCENIILVDSNTFQWFNQDTFDMDLLKEVETYLNQRFKGTDVVNVEQVYNHFQEKLEARGVMTKLHLYSIIKYFLQDQYDIGKGNTLNIYQPDAEKLDAETALIQLINELGGLCDKADLKERLLWQQYKLDLTVSQSKKILGWGTSKVITFERLGLTDTVKQMIIDLTESKIRQNGGYAFVGNLLTDMKFNPALATVIQENEIDDTAKLASILRILMPEVRTQNNFMYVQDSKCKSIEDYLLHKFNGQVTRKQLMVELKQAGYKGIMPNNILFNLMTQRLYIEIDLGVLYPSEQLQVTDEEAKAVVQYIDNEISGKEYISLHKLKGYKRKLPDIGLRWNPFLMKSILVEHGYRQITKIMNDYRYDKILLVKQESDIKTFEQLVYRVLKNEYSGNMHERSVYDFLSEKGIVREQDSPSGKVLPHELRNVQNSVNVDEIGIVSLV